jgi:hypothetical protein
MNWCGSSLTGPPAVANRLALGHRAVTMSDPVCREDIDETSTPWSPVLVDDETSWNAGRPREEDAVQHSAAASFGESV